VIANVQRTKICHTVAVTEELKVPVSILDDGAITDTVTATYAPAIIVYHEGTTLSTGHYTTDVLAENGGWYNINDNSIAMRSAAAGEEEMSDIGGARRVRRSAKSTAGQAQLVVYKRK
jgi:ubiquitin C-terminal hydrolase